MKEHIIRVVSKFVANMDTTSETNNKLYGSFVTIKELTNDSKFKEDSIEWDLARYRRNILLSAIVIPKIQIIESCVNPNFLRNMSDDDIISAFFICKSELTF